MTDEPFTGDDMFIEMSGVPVRIEQGGHNAGNISVPAPTAGDIGEVLTVQPDLTLAWNAVASSNTVLETTVVISNADLKAANSVTLLAAPGAGKFIQPMYFVATCDVATASVFTNAPSMNFRYNDSATGQESSSLGSVTFWQSSTATIYRLILQVAGTNDQANFVNQPLTCRLSAAVTGNAANNKTVTIRLQYRIVNI